MKNKSTSEEFDHRESRMVKHDFIYVVVLNCILLAIMVGLYFWNRSSGELDRLFSQFVKF